MKKKDKTIYDFILKEFGLVISPLLENAIMNPAIVETMNNNALEQIVNEFAPVYQKYNCFLDGEKESQRISAFEMFLVCRLNNKPELQRILYGDVFC